MIHKLMLLICLFPAALRAEFTPQSIAEAIQFFLENPNAQPTQEQIEAHRNTKFFLIKGLAAEFIPGYWSAAEKQINQLLGVSRGDEKQVYRVNGDSTKPLEGYLAHVDSQMKKVIEESSPETRFISVGHSLGGLSNWILMMRNQRLFEEKMLGTLFVQAPFGGSPLVNFVTQGRKVGEIDPFWKGPYTYFLRQMLLLPYSSSAIRPSLQAVEPIAALKQVARTKNEFGIPTGALAERTLYLTTQSPQYEGIQNFLPITNGLMSVCIGALHSLGAGPNDGMVPLKKQSFKQVADRTAHIDNLNHSDFTQNSRVGKAFGKALFTIPAGGKP